MTRNAKLQITCCYISDIKIQVDFTESTQLLYPWIETVWTHGLPIVGTSSKAKPYSPLIRISYSSLQNIVLLTYLPKRWILRRYWLRIVSVSQLKERLQWVGCDVGVDFRHEHRDQRYLPPWFDFHHSIKRHLRDREQDTHVHWTLERAIVDRDDELFFMSNLLEPLCVVFQLLGIEILCKILNWSGNLCYFCISKSASSHSRGLLTREYGSPFDDFMEWNRNARYVLRRTLRIFLLASFTRLVKRRPWALVNLAHVHVQTLEVLDGLTFFFAFRQSVHILFFSAFSLVYCAAALSRNLGGNLRGVTARTTGKLGAGRTGGAGPRLDWLWTGGLACVWLWGVLEAKIGQSICKSSSPLSNQPKSWPLPLFIICEFGFDCNSVSCGSSKPSILKPSKTDACEWSQSPSCRGVCVKSKKSEKYCCLGMATALSERVAC